MTKDQRTLTVVCLGLIVLALLFPPFVYTHLGGYALPDKTAVLYGFVLSDPPRPEFDPYTQPWQWQYNGVSFWRLFVELGVVIVGGIAASIFMKINMKGTPPALP